MTKYYPVTEDELTQIKNDCYYPSVLSCDDCDFADEMIGCNWKGANRLEDEVLERPDPLEVLETWTQHEFKKLYQNEGYEEVIDFLKNLVYYQQEIINRLHKNPQEVVKEGIRDGWWKV